MNKETVRYIRVTHPNRNIIEIWGVSSDGKEKCFKDPSGNFERYKTWRDPDEDGDDNIFQWCDTHEYIHEELTEEEAVLELL